MDDPKICPVCSKPNKCAVAESSDPNSPDLKCWCMDLELSEEYVEKAKQKHWPNDLPPNVCICEACIKGLTRQEDKPSD